MYGNSRGTFQAEHRPGKLPRCRLECAGCMLIDVCILCGRMRAGSYQCEYREVNRQIDWALGWTPVGTLGTLGRCRGTQPRRKGTDTYIHSTYYQSKVPVVQYLAGTPAAAALPARPRAPQLGNGCPDPGPGAGPWLARKPGLWVTQGRKARPRRQDTGSSSMAWHRHGVGRSAVVPWSHEP